MIYVVIKNELKTFETDIRDLCMAFFTLQKITYIFDDIKTNSIVEKNQLSKNYTKAGYSGNEKDIIVNNYYQGDLTGDRLKIKSELKRQLYIYLSKLTGKKLLWGTLTGIRPVNIVTEFIESNKTNHYRAKKNKIIDTFGLSSITEIDNSIYKENEEIKKYLTNEYLISDEKAYELIKIARNEIKILNRENINNFKNSYSVYVGVPFCKSTCLYCSFTSFNIDKFKNYVEKYLDTLERDFQQRIVNINNKKENLDLNNSIIKNKLSPMTLYIGGGTPTSLDEESFEKLLSIIDKYVDRKKCVEYTVEAGRPDTITKEKLLLMKKHEITRISINPQSFNQKTLDLIGRKHKVKDVIEKFKLARDLGFDNINMDIILGLPNEHLFDVIKTLNGIRKLNPDSFTVHSLALKRAARLNFELDSWINNFYLAGIGNLNKSSFIQEGKREIDKMFRWSEKLAEFLKCKPYYLYRQKNIAGNLENVGYAKNGKECIYNIMMMSERHSVYGFGTATTKEVFYENGGKRIESIEGYKSVIDYCERVGK